MTESRVNVQKDPHSAILAFSAFSKSTIESLVISLRL